MKIATDVAARGLDIPNVDVVIHTNGVINITHLLSCLCYDVNKYIIYNIHIYRLIY